MSSIIQASLSTAGVLILIPILFSICIILFPIAVFTTYFAFVALAIRAALVHAQVVGALLRRWLNLDDDQTSAWTTKTRIEELENYQKKTRSRRQSLAEAYTFPPRLHRKRTSTSSNSSSRTVTDTKEQGTTTSSSSSSTSPASPDPSRASSDRSATRDYEGVGGWYPLVTSAEPDPGSASLEWLVSNARLELPDGDVSSTRPRTPEERRRSASIGGRSHRSMTSLQRRGHERSATGESCELLQPGESDSLRSSSSRASSLYPRSKSGILPQPPFTDLEQNAGNLRPDQSRNKGMMYLEEKGSRLVYRLAGLKSLGKKKVKREPFAVSPEESAGEGQIGQGHRRPKSVCYDFTESKSTSGSGPSSVDGVELGGLTMWMQP